MHKLLLFVPVVLIPAVIVGISNLDVFPDSAWAATLMLVVTVGIAAIFTWKSGDATEKISRYCIVADFVIAAILCLNLGSHWLLAREVSAAQQGVTERHTEEDREEKRRNDEAQRRIDVAKAEGDLQEKERRRLRMLPVEERRSVLSAPKAKPQTVASSPAKPEGKAELEAKLSPEQVRAKWWLLLTALAFAECFASVLAGAILCGVWEWDRNRNGIADHLERPQGRTAELQELETLYARPTGRLEEPQAPKVYRR